MTGKAKLIAMAVAGVILTLAGLTVPVWLPSEREGVVYQTGEADQGPIRRFIATSGPVRALVTVGVGSQLSGQIRELKVDFNSEVRAGDELAIIDDKTHLARHLRSKLRTRGQATRSLVTSRSSVVLLPKIRMTLSSTTMLDNRANIGLP